MGRTGIAELRLFIRWLRNEFHFFTVYSAKTRSRGIGRAFLCALHPLFESIEGFLFYLTKKGETCDGQLFDMAFHRFK